MQPLFVDTWAWIALAKTNDPDHQKATKFQQALAQMGFRYITTNFVLDETYTLLRRQVSLKRTIQFHGSIEQAVASPALDIITITPDIERDAWRLFALYDTVQGLSYTDCTSFAMMQRYGLRQVFTNDQHFAMAGFELMPA